MNKSFLVFLALAVILGATLGGAFVGGVALGKSQGDNAPASASTNLGSNATSRNFGAGGASQSASAGNVAGASGFGNRQGAGGFGLVGGNGVAGTIEKIEGNTITLTTAQGATQVTVNDATAIQKLTTGTLADLQTGQRLIVTGERDADGNVTATRIMEQPEGLLGLPSGGGPGGNRNRGGQGGSGSQRAQQ